MGTIWGLLKFILELWEALKVFLGMVEKVKHDTAVKEVDENVKVIVPEKGEEERREATKNLEDAFNKHV